MRGQRPREGLTTVAGVDAMLSRVRRLERARVAPRSPLERAYGSMEAFADEMQAGMDAGTLDRNDMPVILASLRRWHQEGVWGAWHRQSVLEYGR